MKYLKKYNESVSFENQLETFCKENLAYLIDEGYYVGLDEEVEDEDYLRITFTNMGKNFNWNDIKEDFIPFLELLKEKYEIWDPIPSWVVRKVIPEVLVSARLTYNHGAFDNYYFSIDEVINDDINNGSYTNLQKDFLVKIQIDITNK